MEIVRHEVREFTILEIKGKVDWENAQTLDKQLGGVIDDGHHRLALNLDEVSFICSGGIGAMVYNLNKLKRTGGELYLIFSNDYIHFMFESLRFDLLFSGHIFPSYERFCEKVFDEYVPLPE